MLITGLLYHCRLPLLHSPRPQVPLHRCYLFQQQVYLRAATTTQRISSPCRPPPVPHPLKPGHHTSRRSSSRYFPHSHPDQAFAAYIRTGLQTGLRIGFTSARSHLRPRGRNCSGTQGSHRPTLNSLPTDPSHLSFSLQVQWAWYQNPTSRANGI